MNSDTMQQLAAETRRERLQEAQRERLAATRRSRATRQLAPRFCETLGHLLAAHRRPVPR